MASRRLQIRDAIVARLAGDGLPAGAGVHPARTLPYDAASLGPAGAIAVYFVQEPSVKVGGVGHQGYLARRQLVLRVECRVVAGSTEDLDTKLDALTTHAVRAILSDPRVGGLTVDVVEGSTQWETADLDQLYGGAAVDFLVDYITAAHDPEAAK